MVDDGLPADLRAGDLAELAHDHEDGAAGEVSDEQWLREQLHNDPRFDVVGVVTMPDKPNGRGHHMQENIIATTSAALGITDIMKPTTLKSTSEDLVSHQVKSLQADYFVVVAYGKIMPQHILDIPVF